MGQIADGFASTFRPFVTDGVPASGANKPSKAEAVALGKTIETAIGGAAAGLKPYATKALLDADTTQPLGTLAHVYDDPTPANNVVYHYETGGWVVDTIYYEGVAAVVQPIVDEAIDSAEAATGLATDARDEIRALQPIIDSSRPALGEMVGYGRTLPTSTSSTALSNGLRFVNGGGDGSFILFDFPVLDADRRSIPVGTKMTALTVFDVSDAFEARVGMPSTAFQTFLVYADGTFTFEAGEVDTRLTRFEDGYLVWATTFTWAANIVRVGGQVQWPIVPSFSGEETVQVQSKTILIDQLPRGYADTAPVLADAINAERHRFGYAQAFRVGTDIADLSAVEIARIGTRPEFATAQIIPPIGINPVSTRVVLPDNVGITAKQRLRTILLGFQPNNAAAQTITDYEIIRADHTHHQENFTAIVRNGRYAEHIEGAGASVDYNITLSNVSLWHQGNRGARDYIASQGGDPNSLFASTVALGIGTGSGGHITADRGGRFRGENGSVLIHNNLDFARPCSLTLRNKELVPDGPISPFLSVTSLGSGTDDWVEVTNCSTRGHLAIQAGWAQTDITKQPANHMEFNVFGSGNGMFGHIITDPGRALRVRHSTLGASYCAVSGSAVAILFGEVTREDGAPGLRPYSYGYEDIRGGDYTPVGAAISIGARLGDRRTAPLSLVVDASGSAPVTITLNQDYRAQSNATILAAWNTALGSAAKFDEYAIGERYRPQFYDTEATMMNTGTTTILMGTMVAYLPGGYVCRNAVAGDETSTLYRIGIALEDIRPYDASEVITRSTGRVQTSGLVNFEQLLSFGWDAATLAVGDTFQPIQVNSNLVDFDGAKGVLFRKTSGVGALVCVRPRIVIAPYSTPAFLLIR